MMLRCSRRVLLAAFVAASALLPAGAEAHAIVIEASPPVDGVLTGDGADIRLRFNGRIDAVRSTMTLYGPDGSERRLPPSRNENPDILAAHLSGLAPGKYRLRWQVLAVDGHISRGDIPFRVSAP